MRRMAWQGLRGHGQLPPGHRNAAALCPHPPWGLRPTRRVRWPLCRSGLTSPEGWARKSAQPTAKAPGGAGERPALAAPDWGGGLQRASGQGLDSVTFSLPWLLSTYCVHRAPLPWRKPTSQNPCSGGIRSVGEETRQHKDTHATGVVGRNSRQQSERGEGGSPPGFVVQEDEDVGARVGIFDLPTFSRDPCFSACSCWVLKTGFWTEKHGSACLIL